MNLITDRTLLDVERWKELRNKGWNGMTEQERQEWMGEITSTPSAVKGMYTHNDFNRVESAVKALSERLTELGYKHSPLVVKTDWSYDDEVWKQDMERYLSNIATIRKTIHVFPNTPTTPTVNNNLDYMSANDIEKILIDVDTIATNIVKTQKYVGEIISGEV